MFITALRKQMRWIMLVLAVVFGGSLLYVGGPGFFAGGDQAINQALAQTVAEVNGDSITQAELQSVYRNNLAAYRQIFGNLAPGQNEQIMYQSLDQIIRYRLMLQGARSSGLEISAGEINQELEEIKASFGSEAAFRAQLRAIGLSERDLREMIRENLLVRRMEETVRGDVEVTEEDIREAYEEVRARHILIRPEGSPEEWDEAAWEQARQKAEALRAQLENGADFAQLAQEHSADVASAVQGGDVGFFSRRSPFVEPFKEAAFALNVNELSQPVRTDFGYHIIQVTERREAEGEEFQQAREDIESRLRDEKGERRLQEWLAGQWEQADVVIHDARLRARRAVVEGRLEDALREYEQALEEDPFDPYLHVSVSSVYQQMGRDDEALQQLETAVSKAPDDASLQLMLGLSLWRADRGEEAAEAMIKASDLAEWDPNVQLTAQRILSELGYEEEAAVAETRLQAIIDAWEEGQAARRAEEEGWLDLFEDVDEPGAGESEPTGSPDRASASEPAQEASPQEEPAQQAPPEQQ